MGMLDFAKESAAQGLKMAQESQDLAREMLKVQREILALLRRMEERHGAL